MNDRCEYFAATFLKYARAFNQANIKHHPVAPGEIPYALNYVYAIPRTMLNITT